MNKPCLSHITLLLAICLMFAPLAVTTVKAQNTSTTTSTQTSSSPAQTTSTQNTSKQTTSTTSTQTVPTQTTQTTSVDPMWIAAGVIGLLALLAIALLAMRGRSTDKTASVRESTTVIKKD